MYIGWLHDKPSNATDQRQHAKPAEPATKPVAVEIVASVDAASKAISRAPELSASIMASRTDDPCDVIIFTDGSEVSGHVTEVTDEVIRYKRCDQQDGPVYTVRRSQVFMIKYANGTREVIRQQQPVVSAPAVVLQQRPVSRETHPYAVMSLIFGILGIFSVFPGVAAVVFGALAEKKIRNDPDRYKGLNMATIGKVLGIIECVALALFLLIIILAAASI